MAVSWTEAMAPRFLASLTCDIVLYDKRDEDGEELINEDGEELLNEDGEELINKDGVRRRMPEEEGGRGKGRKERKTQLPKQLEESLGAAEKTMTSRHTVPYVCIFCFCRPWGRPIEFRLVYEHSTGNMASYHLSSCPRRSSQTGVCCHMLAYAWLQNDDCTIT